MYLHYATTQRLKIQTWKIEKKLKIIAASEAATTTSVNRKRLDYCEGSSVKTIDELKTTGSSLTEAVNKTTTLAEAAEDEGEKATATTAAASCCSPTSTSSSSIINNNITPTSSFIGGSEVVKAPKNRMLSGWKSRDGERDKWRLRDDDGYRIRAAALCIKGTGKETLVLLVSGGKDGAKWVVPGGGVEKDEGAEEAAHRELMEEAGVKANTLKNIGLFQDDVRKHRTQVFLMQVEEELQTWEENEYGRQRIWMPLIEGAEKVKQNHRAMIEAILTR